MAHPQLARNATPANYSALDCVNLLRACLLQHGAVRVMRHEEAKARLAQPTGSVAAFLERSGSGGPLAAQPLQRRFAERSAGRPKGCRTRSPHAPLKGANRPAT